MSQEGIAFGVGLLVGGLSLSACWSLFWVAIGTAGLIRGSCSWRVVLNSLMVGAVPLTLVAGLTWWPGGVYEVNSAFGMGMMGMPIVLLGFGLRQAPDGRRAWAHMLDRVRHLVAELLGRHHECGGCGGGHQR